MHSLNFLIQLAALGRDCGERAVPCEQKEGELGVEEEKEGEEKEDEVEEVEEVTWKRARYGIWRWLME